MAFNGLIRHQIDANLMAGLMTLLVPYTPVGRNKPRLAIVDAQCTRARHGVPPEVVKFLWSQPDGDKRVGHSLL